MDSNIEFSLQRVSKALSAKPYYRAVVQPKGIFGTKEFADRLAERTKEEAIHWRYFLNVIADEIETLLLEGNRVNLGRLAMSLAIRGSFASEDEVFDPSKHSLAAVVRALKPFMDKLEAAVPENITAGITCRVAAAMDSVTKRLSEITGTNRLLIQDTKPNHSNHLRHLPDRNSSSDGHHVLPRQNRRQIAFQSKTTVHNLRTVREGQATHRRGQPSRPEGRR